MSYTMGNVVTAVALGLVVLVLVAGLVNMMRGGSPSTSQKLMRLRVVLQLVAIGVIMCVLYLRQH